MKLFRWCSAGIFVVAACEGGQCGKRGEPTPVTAPAPLAPAASWVPVAPATPSDRPVIDAAFEAPTSLRPTEGAGVVACGNETCRVNETACCSSPKRSFCTARKPTAADQNFPERACSLSPDGGEETGPSSAFDYRRCDAANDCPEGQLCCESWNGEMRETLVFLTRCAADKPGKCGDWEACIRDADCPTGAKCVKRRCEAQKHGLACGKTTCKVGEICCDDGDEPLCKVPREGCVKELACTRPSDCPGILRCVRGMAAECRGKFHAHMHETIACDTDANCRDGFVPGKPNCRDGWCVGRDP